MRRKTKKTDKKEKTRKTEEKEKTTKMEEKHNAKNTEEKEKTKVRLSSGKIQETPVIQYNGRGSILIFLYPGI